MTTYATPIEAAEAIATAVEAFDGLTAKVWTKGGRPRVYVSRMLSGGRQDCGYVEVLGTDRMNVNPLTSRKAGIRDAITKATGIRV